MQAKAPPITAASIEFDGDTPVSTIYEDSYFMRGHGVAESEAVFIQASRLPQRFSALGRGQVFVIGETGFGSGLNCLLAAKSFQTNAPAGARLHLVSAELHPMRQADLTRALASWPAMKGLGSRLLQSYPPPIPGYHRLQLGPGIDLTLMFGDAITSWATARFGVDAWFLDGFAPSRNPQMWQPELFQAMASRSRPGASVATFSAAGLVRRGLEQAGFAVRREAGFNGKRHRLAAYWPGRSAPKNSFQGHALVAGAGLAGATTARALAERDWQVTVCDPAGIARGASGNHAGVVYSTPSAHLTPQNRFYQTALWQARRWMAAHGFPSRPEDGCLNDIIQYPADDRSRAKLLSAMHSGAWPDELLERHKDSGFVLKNAGFIRPDRWCQHLMDHPGIRFSRSAIRHFEPGRPVATTLDNGSEMETDLLVLCLAETVRSLTSLDWLPLKLIRGQVTYCAATPQSRLWGQAVCHAGYLTPALDDLHCVGATFDLDRQDPCVDPADDCANLAQLRAHLPDQWQALGGDTIKVVGSRAAIRCQTTDFLPLVGPVPDHTTSPHHMLTGIYLNLAHGSRGITHTPLCADLIADQASGLPPPADPGVIDALAPERFILRHRRKVQKRVGKSGS